MDFFFLKGSEFVSHSEDPEKLCYISRSPLPCCLNNKAYFMYQVFTDKKPRNPDVPEGGVGRDQALR